ncbi:GNAT family N-acetyltransferase [Marinimicrococcus flavescens]|uniref:GNAT family N-acetyltransferase n=1 Tax=Marinimicrococcus flavescens TaxID=3031815 RepID=A0AAP3XTP4_9PROT|nr:GNAT family N-acetyltransferase [Marinimicrococcus flavescens]
MSGSSVRPSGVAPSADEPSGKVRHGTAMPAITPFVPDDDAACRRLAARAALSSYGPPLPHARARFAEDHPLDPAELRLVARMDSRIAGFLELNGSHIDNLLVDPAFQGRGIGTSLLRHVMVGATSDLTLSVFTVNPAARRLYERHGFAVEELRTIDFAGGKADVWRMRWRRQPR